MLVSPLPPSFLDTYYLSTSSLGCNALCMVISFLVLSSICLSSRVHFKKGPEYLTRGIYSFDKVSVWLFCLEQLSSSPEIFFLHFFFHLHFFNGVDLQVVQVFVGFVFSGRCNLVLIWQFHSVSQMSFTVFYY